MHLHVSLQDFTHFSFEASLFVWIILSYEAQRSESAISECNNPSSPSLQPVNYSNPVYAKIYIDGQNCRKPVISIDERRELLPKKLEGTIHETAA